VAESAAKRYFSTTNGTNVPSETVVPVRGDLPVFVLLASYGYPGSIFGRGKIFGETLEDTTTYGAGLTESYCRSSRMLAGYSDARKRTDDHSSGHFVSR
jgi:hypothetical protein